MDNDAEFYTVTMARVYADQGHWDKAVEIYRHLLAASPEREDLAEALAEAEKKMNAASDNDPDNLVLLMRRWIDLLFRYDRLQKLRRFKNRF